MLRVVNLAGAVALILTISSAPATAHAGGSWYDNDGGASQRFPWDSASDTIYAFSSGSTWPSGWKTAIEIAHSQWNVALGSSLFDASTQEQTFPGTNCNNDPLGQQIVRRGDADNNAMAITVRCESTSGVWGRWWITIDPDFSWYVGSGQAPSNQQHLKGVMAHEFGHATGFGTGSSEKDHFQESDDSTCPSTAFLRDTMCVRWGTSDGFEDFQHQMLSLEAHDIHTFLNIY